MYTIYDDKMSLSAVLRVIQEDDGVMIAVVDSEGKPAKRGRIVKLLNDGRLLRFTDVDPKCVRVNSNGEILTTDDL